MCLRLGIDDPRAWLDTASEDVVTLWDAYYRLEPWGGDYQRHAAEMELLEHIFAVMVNRHAPRERKDLMYRPRKRRQFMPPDYAGEIRKMKQRTTIADQCQQYADTILQQVRK